MVLLMGLVISLVGLFFIYLVFRCGTVPIAIGLLIVLFVLIYFATKAMLCLPVS